MATRDVAIHASRQIEGENNGTPTSNPAVAELRQRLLAEEPPDAEYDADPQVASPYLHYAMTMKYQSVLAGDPLELGAELHLSTASDHGIDPETGDWIEEDPGVMYAVSTPSCPMPDSPLRLIINYE